jgi:phosphoserine phosphatase RsbU/P
MNISFKAKLIIFAMLLILIPSVILVSFFIINFTSITSFSLEQNKQSITESTEEYLTNFVDEEASLIYKELEGAINNLSSIGRSAQLIIDNYNQLANLEDIYQIGLFNTELIQYGEALTNPSDDTKANVLVPPELTDEEKALEWVKVSSILNLMLESTFESNINNSFLYFVGDKDNPITRAYPNIGLASVLDSQDILDFQFWREGERGFFAENVQYWEMFFKDNDFRESVMGKVGSRVTVEPPYEDAAGQGTTITMFYPLWDKDENDFAGVMGLDITLNNIIQNILSVEIAKTGYAFLMNGRGEIIAMPQQGFDTLMVDLEEIKIGGLSYYRGNIASSSDSSVQNVYQDILSNERGYTTITLDNGERTIMSYSTMEAINDKTYNPDRWKVVTVVPEREILSRLIETDKEIRENSSNLIYISIIFVIILIIIVALFSIWFSTRFTRNINNLASVAEKISKKDYNVPDVKITQKDEIGELGKAFNVMKKEIKDYTENLENMVTERTEELRIVNEGLSDALEEIKVLNHRLRDENIRLGAELDIARKLQLMVLPTEQEIKSIPDLEIASVMKPADEVGGDYFDIFRKNGSVLFGIGDVTGHGLASGVIMLMTQTAVQALSQSGITDMKQVMNTLNHVLYKNIERIQEEKNLTLSLIDYKEKQYTIVGQHESIIICRKDGFIEVKDTIDLGLYVGLEPDISAFVNEIKIKLDAGDIMVLFTDGITEAINETKEEFGMDRLCKLIQKYHKSSSKELLKNVLDNLYNYIGNARIYDDISMVVIKQK